MGMARTQRLLHTTSYHCWGQGKGTLLWVQGDLVQLSKCGGGSCLVLCIVLGFPCESVLSCSLCHYYCCCYCVFSFFIAVPKTLSLSQLVIFTLWTSKSPLQLPSAGGAKGKQGAAEQHMGWRVSVGAQNWGMSFLNLKNAHYVLERER